MGRGTSQSTAAPLRRAQIDARDEAQTLLAGEPLAGNDVALLALVGSRAYGLEHAGSDSDFRGIYVAPTENALGLIAPSEQLECKEPDMTVFEFGKFCRLAAKANPNVLELLWAPVMHETEIGQLLRANRSLFLSQLVRATYAGYAHSQARKVASIEASRPERRAKFARHLFRLFDQGRQLLTEGDMDIRVSDPDHLRALSELSPEEIQARFDVLDTEFRETASSLPERADFEAISKLMVEVRLAKLGS